MGWEFLQRQTGSYPPCQDHYWRSISEETDVNLNMEGWQLKGVLTLQMAYGQDHRSPKIKLGKKNHHCNLLPPTSV